ncbi:MAG: RnfABCDGE type electron transport complex subunit A [Candidatus Methanoliparum thermophilum]|uniref:Ion-translocating oxidoreductase complex subunit A n=1 Tax=Methanoliparum thermophilum TaxID=2491083 RepID=A0A520KU16_METT2|nr:RnfABCDGE type electron transport complex subunit A [Candidatus Methanoliparum sp. LAM-1]RZN65612.1 MAG: RnfABCDGE type electron transport complex subunit A [Candidatus Methanoliparum thermophilum]BDC36490.1 electron transport complex subunit A [Candidatus Methanoliparum sp. LAM-1]
MNELLSLFLRYALVNNFILVMFLGLCPFFGVSKKLSDAIRMGLAVTFVMIASSIITWLIANFILIPFNIEFMETVVFILVIASFVQLLEMVIRKTSIGLYRALGIYLPLITTNCAVLGIAEINFLEGFSFLGSIASSSGAGVGFILALTIMSGLRERLELSEVPGSLKGLPIAFITASILSLSFLTFGGLRI